MNSGNYAEHRKDPANLVAEVAMNFSASGQGLVSIRIGFCSAPRSRTEVSQHLALEPAVSA
ncbi:hypothetical protein [Mycolicibacterium sp.]|uniref:hypothetical protein n=1 Tax=Mycolicibacterium sp. TaxID=2320850 RepID=UPI0025ED0F3D|nr:hypothetical protein [Mycolicibacterium sp.]